MILALKVTDSNCKIWLIASIKNLRELKGIFIFGDILKWVFFGIKLYSCYMKDCG
jgi:hypothetical protein